jgi:glycosyltransferase involved in cell wall biosynthesis
MRKKRVLFVSECHELASGFGTYAKQVLPRLAATGKYELAEFASYGKPENGNVDWLYFSNSPESEEEQNLFNQHHANHFGYWRFDKVALTFKPDIVLTYRDPWMDEWIEHSPLRPFFNWIWMPTVDSAPQKRKWLETFSNCDALLAYSEYGEKTLKEQSNDTLNVLGCASPAIDPSLYSPVADKKAHKKKFNLPPDINIVGTVMRNQRRKLFFELMKAFKIFLETAPPEVAKKTFLYLHTSYPEPQGWDIAEGILEFGLASKVLTTYICRQCKNFHCSVFQDAISVCPSCNHRSAVMPSVGLGLSIPDLIQVYNLFDMYVQYAICEGFGMPQVEAAACGVPVAAVNYSAMEDVVKFTGGYPVNVKSFYRELETGADRAHPDNDHLAQILTDHFSLSEEDRNKKCYKTRMSTIKRYDWDRTAKVWENAIDNANLVGLQGKWDAPRLPAQPLPPSIPDIPDHEDFVRWSYVQLLKEPLKAYSYEAAEFIQSLGFGSPVNGGGPFNREIFWDIMNQKITNKIQAEDVRTGVRNLIKEKFLEDAYRRFQK